MDRQFIDGYTTQKGVCDYRIRLTAQKFTDLRISEFAN
jgi:hypothetical protein